MLAVLAQHQIGAAARGDHVLGQVRAVDRAPDPQRRLLRLLVGELRVAAEVRARIGEGGAPQLQEPVHVPALHVLHPGVDVDGEVEEVRDRHPQAAVTAGTGRLEHVEPLDDQHVRLLDHHPLVLEDVVGQVRVDGRLDALVPGLHIGDEAQQAAPVVALGEPLALHDAARLELGVGVEEAIGGHQLDLRGVRPARHQLPEQSRGGGFADRHRPGHTDHVRGALLMLVQEVLPVAAQRLGGGDLDVQQARDGPVDGIDLLQVETIAQAAQAGDVVLGERQGGLSGQPRPVLP